MTLDPSSPMANPGRRLTEARRRRARLALIHRLPRFLLSTDDPACGMPEPQMTASETQVVHTTDDLFPQDAIRFCEQLGGP